MYYHCSGAVRLLQCCAMPKTWGTQRVGLRGDPWSGPGALLSCWKRLVPSDGWGSCPWSAWGLLHAGLGCCSRPVVCRLRVWQHCNLACKCRQLQRSAMGKGSVANSLEWTFVMMADQCCTSLVAS